MRRWIYICFMAILVQCTDAAPSCGGTISTLTGDIQSPGYPNTAPPNITCNFKFSPNTTTPKSDWFYFHVDVQLQPGDSLFIASQFGRHFFNETQEPFAVIVGPYVNIKFITNASDNGDLRRFEISYKYKDCSILLTGSREVINSPLYGNNTLKVIQCKWQLSRSHDGVSLSFVSFNLTSSYLVVYKGPDTSTAVAGNYTGTILPPDTISPEMQQVTIVMNVNTTADLQHFRAEMTSISKECSDNIIVNATIKQMVLTSPDVDIPQDIILNCVNIFTAPPNTTIIVQVNDLQLNNVRDALIINDGGGKYSPTIFASGIKKEKFLLTRSNVLWFQFLNDLLVSKSSYNITIRVQDVGGIVTSGKFALPSSGKVVRKEVIFQLKVPEGQQVQTMIKLKNVSPYNEVSFVDGDELVHYPLANFTQESMPYPVFSMSNSMYVIARNFSGSASLQGAFSGVPKTGCNVISQETTGSFELRNNLTSACIWLIKPPGTAGVIALFINKLKLGVNDTVRVYKGLANDNLSLIATFKADVPYQQVIYVPVQLGLRFEYSGNITVPVTEEAPYFNAYYLILPECHTVMNLTTGDIRHLKSPGFPAQYPLNTNCTWYIRLPPSKLFHLTFNTVDLHPKHSLQISVFKNGTKQLLSNITGPVSPDNVLINNTEIFIEWNPAPIGLTAVVAKGFDLTAKVLDCGQNITADSGEVSTPLYPQVLNSSISCIWTISVPLSDGKTENSSNIELHIESTNATISLSSFKIHDGPSTTNATIPLINTTLLSKTHQVLIMYDFHFRDELAPGYKIHFTRKGCDVSHQCQNGICMPKAWRCNGINDCGDFSDEFNCTASPVPFIEKSGVPVVWMVVGILIAIAIGIALGLAAPLMLRRIGMIRERYQDFHILPET